jgi:prolyl-tRNA editing enzyme YbaK/EbsC (Cys-tRNA(Pro) deacylase)
LSFASGAMSPGPRVGAARRRALLVEDAVNEETRIHKLCAQGQWDVADALAGTDAGLRAAVDALRVHFSALQSCSQSNNERVGFLALDVPLANVLFVDDEPGLKLAVTCLSNDHVLGLDTEWRPDTYRDEKEKDTNKKNPTSLVQIAGAKSVVLLDVPVLAARCPDALCDALTKILTKTRVSNAGGRALISELPEPLVGTQTEQRTEPPIVLGFGLADDVVRLARSYPGPIGDVFGTLPKVLCLQKLAQGDHSGAHTAHPIGLSSLSQNLLGSPLDKRETCSDWNKRPLSFGQKKYAALDARVLLLLFPKLLGVLSKKEACCLLHHGASVLMSPANGEPGKGKQQQQQRTHPASWLFREHDLVPRCGEFRTWVKATVRATTNVQTRVPPLTPEHAAAALRVCLNPLGVDSTPITLPVDTGPTAKDVANALGGGIDENDVVKAIGIVVSGETSGKTAEKEKRIPYILTLRGGDRVDFAKLGLCLNVKRRKVRLATPDECVNVFGYHPGSMPPTGLRDFADTDGNLVKIKALMDTRVFAKGDARVFPGAGSSDSVFVIPARLLRIATDAKVVDIARSTVAGGCEEGLPTVNVLPSQQDETLSEDLLSLPPEKRNGRFVTDGSLGRLARWLRALGVDAAHVPAGCAGEYQALLELASSENRIVLTRDRRMARRRDFSAVGVFFVSEGTVRPLIISQLSDCLLVQVVTNITTATD